VKTYVRGSAALQYITVITVQTILNRSVEF